MFPSEKKKEESIEIVAEQQQEKKLQFAGSIRPHRGHTLYKVNVKTLEIDKAEFEKQDISFEEVQNKKKPNKKIIIEDGFVYISALNEKNVIKKMPKFGLRPN